MEWYEIGLPSKIHNSYYKVLSLLDELGLEVSQPKLVPPSTSVVCLGIQVNTVELTPSIPHENCLKSNSYVINGPLRTIALKISFNHF